MNRRTHLVVDTAVVAVALAAVGAVMANCSVLYESQIEFCYQDGVPSATVAFHGQNSSEAVSHSIQNRYRSLMFEFADKMYFPLPFEERVRRCQEASELRGECEHRTRAVLSTMRLEVVGMPRTNFAYRCRLVLEDREKRNMDEYARICLAMIKDRLDEDNKVYADKAALNEIEQMRKAERRIGELEKSMLKGNAESSTEEELRQARDTVKKMSARIEEIRKQVMNENAIRIIDDSQPTVSWVIRRRIGKPAAGNQRGQSPAVSE